MPEWPTVVQAAAALIQAATAVVIVVLTKRLANATDAYATSAKDQVTELVAARLATIQPFLHLVGAGVRGYPDPYFIGLTIEAELSNIGSGPAIDAVARLEHDRLEFTTDLPPQTVAPGGSCTLSFTVQRSTTDPGGQALSQDLRLAVEYRDLVGRRWITATPATLGYVRDANGTYREPQVSFRSQEEAVEPVSALSLSRPVLAQNRRLQVWTDPDIWGAN